MQINLSLAKKVKRLYQPKKVLFNRWVAAAILKQFQQVNIDIMIVNSADSQKLNNQYRGRDNPTNVIALEYKESRELFHILYGEIILCDEIIVAEAATQGKDILEHYAHMLIHAMLHLQGLDHQQAQERAYMEKKERAILASFGIANPYEC